MTDVGREFAAPNPVDEESDGTVDEGLDWLVERTRALWLGAILFFGFGDLITTTVGLVTGWAAEAGLLAAMTIAEFGLASMLPLKLAAFAVCYLLWRLASDPHRVGVPLGLVALGVLVTAQNLYVLVVAAAILA